MPALQNKSTTLTLRRSGRFFLRIKKGTNHCGVVRSWEEGINCQYKLFMRCMSTSLDEKGFLVEQLGIHEYFRNLPRTDKSCENLCISCARGIYRKVMRENPDCKILEIRLEIAPGDGNASMEFHWSRSTEEAEKASEKAKKKVTKKKSGARRRDTAWAAWQ